MMTGIILYFPVRTPSLHEIENCTNIVLTSENVWNPYASTYQELEETSYTDNIMLKLSEIMDLNTKEKTLFLSNQQLAQNWAVPILVAHDTLKATTQEFIRSSLHPVEQRYRTKNIMLKYNRLQNSKFILTLSFQIVLPSLGTLVDNSL
jgi:hypothetical protein